MNRQGKKFYKDGIRFQCQRSGKCCLQRDEYGYVYLAVEDRRRLAAHLGLSTLAFTKRYTEKSDGDFVLEQPGGKCPFYKRRKCTAYEARPTQCRTWPFWPENMSPKVWEKEVASYCPGVGKGRLYSAEEIERIIKIQIESAD